MAADATIATNTDDAAAAAVIYRFINSKVWLEISMQYSSFHTVTVALYIYVLLSLTVCVCLCA